jgi:L-iditol 2-dehydrogenase
VLGHEIAGEVVSAGAKVTGWAAGDSVQVIAAIPCGACRECQAGHPTVCTSRENMGYQHDGGFAEFVLVPAKVIAVGGLNRIPDGTGPSKRRWPSRWPASLTRRNCAAWPAAMRC